MDIKVRLRAGTEMAQLAALHEQISDEYPKRGERSAMQAGFKLGPGGSMSMAPPSARVDGYLFTSADGRQIVQARLDGFTANRLKPYRDWATFRDEARRRWEAYCHLVQPEAVSRIALRYINRIEIPGPFADFKEYFLTTPEVAPGLPQGLANFFMRLVLPLEQFGCIAVITETLEEPKADAFPYVLDIDVFTERSFPPTDEEIWRTFETLRLAKNEVFFRSVTPKAQELFK